MRLETTLIVPNHDLHLKPNQRSQFLNFQHPLNVLKKINNQYLQGEMDIGQENIDKEIPKQKTRVNLVAFQKKVNNIIPTQRKAQKKPTLYGISPRQNTRNTQYHCENQRTPKLNQQNVSKISQYNNPKKFFNEDDGILEHLFCKFYTPTNNLAMSSALQLSQSSKMYFKKDQEKLDLGESNVKCFIIFGFSVSLLEIQQFLSLHPEINLTIRLYKYDDNEFDKEVQFCQQDEMNIEEKCTKLSNLINERKIIDCQETTFVITLWKKGTQSGKNQQQQFDKKQQKLEIGEFYFFPNINTERQQQEENNQRRSQAIQSGQRKTLQLNSFQQKFELSYDGNMGSLRKSHQNFRILQILEYYMSLECHSDHMMISPSESLVLRDFLNSIYEKEVREFYIFIDHERNQLYQQGNLQFQNTTSKSIMEVEKQQQMNLSTPQHTQKYLSSLSGPQYISVNGQLMINDQFISKLSSIKPPQPCTDSVQFRKQKKLMYRMKLQQYHEEKQLQIVKKDFTQTINYLNSLIGLQQVTYEEISLQSLKTIKNAKIKQSTSQLKELLNLSHQKDIRCQDLKSKIALYEKIKSENLQQNDHKISTLRKEIIELQKVLNLHKNHLSNIYQTTVQIHNPLSETDLPIPRINHRVSIDGSNHDNYFKNKRLQSKNNNQQLMGKTKSFFKQDNPIQPTEPQKTNPQNQPKLNKKNLASPSTKELKPNRPGGNRTSFINPQLSSPKGESAHSNLNLRGSHQFINKYASILEQLRKQKYQDQLRQQKTKCQFQAEKEFQKLKEQYQKTTKDLLLILGECDCD